MSVLKLLASDAFYATNKYILKKIGLNSAVLYADLASAQNYWNEKNDSFSCWFYRTRETIEEETTLSPKLQRNAIDKLKALKLLKTELRGCPAKMHYLIDSDCELALINLLSSKVTTRCYKKSQLDNNKSTQLDETKSNISKNKDNKNKEEKNKVYKGENLALWLSEFYSRESLSYLPIFQTQLSEKFIRDRIKQLGEKDFERVLFSIEDYCTKNKTYCKERKNLAQVFNKFSKTFKSELIEKSEEVISEVYSELFEEKYQFSISCSKHLTQLIEKIRIGFAAYSKIAPEQVEDDSLIDSLQSFFSKLPKRYKSAEQFKLPLINHNYQSIKNEIRNSSNSKSGSKNINTQGVGNTDSRYGI